MLLVVLGHIDLNNNAVDIYHPIATKIHSIVYGFHMPLFMAISGFLFYLTCISKNKSYRQIIISKLKRLYAPMIFFTFMAYLPKVILASIMKHPAQLSYSYIIDTFIFYKINPLAEMWFIVTLIILMLLYPLYKISVTRVWYEFLFLIIFLGLCLSKIQCDYFQLSQVCYMGFFFYSGIIICKHQLYKYLSSYVSFAISFIIFVILNSINVDIPQILNISGIIFSISLCLNLYKIIPNLFSSFRTYTYQIFLVGIFFQMLVRYLYKIRPNMLPYIAYYILSILVGLYTPVLISKIVKKANWKYLNICFGLK